MSKSKGNVVDPDEMVKTYGADTVRLFCLFAAPPEKDLEWSDQGVEGAARFLSRMWRLVGDWKDELHRAKPFSGRSELPPALAGLHRKTHQTIKKVTEDLRDRFHFNTAIAAIMELVNEMYLLLESGQKNGHYWSVMKAAVETMVLLVSPIVPHIAEELWQALGHAESILRTPWPNWVEEALRAEEVLIVVQVNGKLRSRITVAVDASDEEVRNAVLSDSRTQDFIAGKAIRKVVVIPNKLVNIVV
jgi:leucyl-tRNA synthetase